MLQLVPQPEKTSGCGMKGVESGQVLLGKFAMCELSINNCLCSHVLVSAAYLLWSAQVAPCLFIFLRFSTYYFCICICLNARVLVTFLPVVACACVTCVCVCLKAAGAGAHRMTACLWRSETQTLWSRLRVSCLPAVTLPLASRSASHPLPFPLKAATQEIESCFQTKTREKRRAQTLQKWVVWKGCDGEVYGSKSS